MALWTFSCGADDESEHEQQGRDGDLLSEWLTITGVATLPMEQLQNLIFQEMLHFHPQTIHLNWGAASPEPGLETGLSSSCSVAR